MYGVVNYKGVFALLFLFSVFERPRLHSVSGGLLPSPRHISNMVHQGLGGEIPELGITLFLMQWGQFTDHDIVLTPISTGKSKGASSLPGTTQSTCYIMST